MAWFALVQGEAQAVSCDSPNPSVFNFQLPSGNFGIARDVPIGARISPWTGMQSMGREVWTCMLAAYRPAGPYYRSILQQSGVTFIENGVNYHVYNTNLQGVGLVIGVNSGTRREWYGGDNAKPVSVPPTWGITMGTTNPGATRMQWGTRMNFAFVKTGPIRAGTVSLPGRVAQAGIEEFHKQLPMAGVDVTVSGNPTFSELACSTPNVTVNMGTRSNMDFGGIGSPAPATSFAIDVNNCPAGIQGIQYRLDAVTRVLDAAKSIVALDSNSTARGVGVQLLDNAGAILPLGANRSFTGYRPTAGGSYRIPLRARYHQTAWAITGGTANTAMTFTMTYQ